MKKILIGLSGGVDSAVSALLLKKQGYQVLAAFMKNFSETKNPISGECNWVEEKIMAQRIAAFLDIPLIILDLEKEYTSQVIKPMTESYRKGLTPNPDVACNTIIKFPWLRKAAKKHNCQFIATGHYARIKKQGNVFHLLRAKDESKDQSYFLSELGQADLQNTLFPVGNMTKSQVRTIAKKLKFPNADKKGTKGICFVGKVNLKSFLERTIKNKPGQVKDPEGNIIGKHPGIMYYTIGQRVGQHLGFDIAKSKEHITKKYYIAEKNARTNTLIVAPENHPILSKKSCYLANIHHINTKSKFPIKVKVRIRHLGDLLPATIKTKSNKILVQFTKPISALAAGQVLVVYKGQEVLGCGEIRY